MQQAPPPTPTAPSPPALPSPAAAAGPPQSVADVVGLRALQAELTRQLQAAGAERAQIVSDLQGTGRVTRPGLKQRLDVLDARTLRIEGDLARVNERLSAADPRLLAEAPAPREVTVAVAPRPAAPRGFVAFGPGGWNPNVVPSLLIALVVLQVIVMVRVRRLLDRRPADSRAGGDESSARLARLEHAVGAIAEEVERIGEGQRFVTRLLAESRGSLPIARPAETRDAEPRQGWGDTRAGNMDPRPRGDDGL